MRIAFAIGFALCAALIGYAFYLQHAQLLEPCPLCTLQRLVFMAMGGLFLLGALHDPPGWGGRSYAMAVAFAGLLGALLAGRQLYLQGLSPDELPECGPGLDQLLETLPLGEALAQVFSGAGACSPVSWSFLGMSMPAWTLAWFLGLAGFALLAGWKSTRRHIFLD